VKTTYQPSVRPGVRSWKGCLQIERGNLRLQLWLPTCSASRGHVAVHADSTLRAVWSHNVGLAVQVLGLGLSIEYVPNSATPCPMLDATSDATATQRRNASGEGREV